MRTITFILLGTLISMTVFSYVFYGALGTLSQNYLSKTKTLEKEIALQSSREVATARLPVYLFDIKLEMDKTKITQGEEPTARVVFTSFGTAPTPVAMTFTIVDVSSGDEVHQEADAVIVETETVFTKKFTNFKPKPGKYLLVLKTVYGYNVKDEFKQEFEVVGNKFLGIF